MSDFNKALQVVLKHEGGYVDNPADRGGPTNFGITMRAASDYLGGCAVNNAYIRNLTPTVAGAIYRKNFWVPLHLDECVDPKLCCVVLDLAVLCGMSGITRIIQRILSLPDDGKFGPATKEEWLESAHQDPEALICCLLDRAEHHFRGIALDDPKQEVFLSGWLNRIADLKKEFT